LDELPPGAAAAVVEVGGEGAFRRRLMELGLVPGTTIRRTGASSFGDPLSFQVRGAVLCLRRADARAVVVHAA
jgi:ferrous iron transport protein A